MTTYTGVADANGDFTIPFSSNYTGGQKVTVTSEKLGATKSIELFAPSTPTGGGAIQFSGNLVDFPNNIGVITLSNEISGVIQDYAMQALDSQTHIFDKATGLIINSSVTSIGRQAFATWTTATILSLPSSLTDIGISAFSGWTKLLEIVIPNSVENITSSTFQSATACKKLTLGSGLTTIGTGSFSNLTACDEMIVLSIAPPSIHGTTFSDLKSTCVIKVPSGSLAAYQAAANWSALASKMIGV